MTVAAGIQLCLVFASLGAGEPAIAIKDVPEYLTVPIRGGANLILTVTLIDANARAVWLGPDDDSKPKASLSAAGADTYQINLADPQVARILDRSKPVRGFRVYAELSDGRLISSISIQFRGGKARLDLPNAPASVTVREYQSEPIEGSDRTLFIEVERISRGRATVKVCDATFTPISNTRNLRIGESIAFAVGEQEYVVGYRGYRKHLLHGDEADFLVCREEKWESVRIEMALDRIQRASNSFVVDDKTLTGKQFAALLRSRCEKVKPRNLGEFINEVASATGTGKPVLVRATNGDESSAKDWLSDEFGMRPTKATSAPASSPSP